jgi:hypothetical protein
MIYRTIIHFGLAILLFYLINWLGRHSTALGYKKLSLLLEPDEAPAFNLLFRILTPVVFLLLLSALFYAVSLDHLNHNLYLIVIYYFLYRISYNVIYGRARLLNWPIQLSYVIITSGLSYAAQIYLISNKSYFFPNMETLGNQLWLLIIGFIYLLLNSFRGSQSNTQKRKNAYLNHRYRLYRKRYGRIIASIVDNQSLEALIYSIMIYEAFNRPKAFRYLESIGFFLGVSKTLGIMQVTTTKFITDSQSVKLACKKIIEDMSAEKDNLRNKDYSEYPQLASKHMNELKEHDLLNGILKQYNGGSLYTTEVLGIFRQIRSKYYPTAPAL